MCWCKSLYICIQLGRACSTICIYFIYLIICIYLYKHTVTYYTYWYIYIYIYCVAQTVHAENTGNGNDHVCSKSFWTSYLKCTSGQFQYFANIKDAIPSNKSLGHYKLLHRTLFQPGHPSRWGVYKLNCLERLPQFSPGAPELDAWLVSDKEVTQRSKQFKVSVHSLNPTKKLVLQRLRAISDWSIPSISHVVLPNRLCVRHVLSPAEKSFQVTPFKEETCQAAF